MPRAKQPSWKGLPVQTSDDRDTSRQLRAAIEVEPDPVLSDDVHEALGQVMAEVLRGSARVANLSEEVSTLTREVGQLTRELADHREASDNAAKKAGTTAAAHTSNRLAILMGALVTLYEVAQPVLHEIWKGLH